MRGLAALVARGPEPAAAAASRGWPRVAPRRPSPRPSPASRGEGGGLTRRHDRADAVAGLPRRAGVRGHRGAGGGAQRLRPGDLRLLRGGDRHRRRHAARPADRGAGVLGRDRGYVSSAWRRRWRSGSSGRGRGCSAALLWLDALGLAAYAIVGAAKAAAYGVPPVVCVLMGALTATFGGVLRDVLAGEPSVLLRREITITAGAGGGGRVRALRWAGLEPGSRPASASRWASGLRGGRAAVGLVAAGVPRPALNLSRSTA